jgi:hypothetical protein
MTISPKIIVRIKKKIIKIVLNNNYYLPVGHAEDITSAT